MNIHFSELDNNENNKFDYESQFNSPEKYWENQHNQVPVKKKKVSFDDILSNMNLVVNQKGVLQFMQPMQNEEYYPEPQYEQPYQEYVAQQLSQRPQQQQTNQQQAPIDPSLKNSFLYNKYFKDYKDANTYEPQIRVPKTMEEYRQMLLEDKIKEIEQKKKISQIKSTKLLFTTNINNQSNNIIPSRNNLRSMNFH
jgi:hypothetical protein